MPCTGAAPKIDAFLTFRLSTACNLLSTLLFMQAERQTWTDERMDDFAARTDANFAEVRGEVRDFRAEVRGEFRAVRGEVRAEVGGLRTEIGGVREEIGGLRAEMNVRFASLERRFDILIGALVSGVVGLIVTHLLG